MRICREAQDSSCCYARNDWKSAAVYLSCSMQKCMQALTAHYCGLESTVACVTRALVADRQHNDSCTQENPGPLLDVLHAFSRGSARRMHMKVLTGSCESASRRMNRRRWSRDVPRRSLASRLTCVKLAPHFWNFKIFKVVPGYSTLKKEFSYKYQM